MSRLQQVIREDLGRCQPHVWLLDLLAHLLPEGCCGRLRTRLYRSFGLSIGHATCLHGALKWPMSTRLSYIHIGERCFINCEVFLDASAPITIGNDVGIGHHVRIITSNHDIGPASARMGRLRCSPVTIENGSWIAAGVTLLPGITVGRGSVVAAGAVVTGDVAPNTLVGGIPARIIRHLEVDDRKRQESVLTGSTTREYTSIER